MVEIKHPDGPCSNCGSREFIRVWGLYEQHDRVPDDGNQELATSRFECKDCGTSEQVRGTPK